MTALDPEDRHSAPHMGPASAIYGLLTEGGRFSRTATATATATATMAMAMEESCPRVLLDTYYRAVHLAQAQPGIAESCNPQQPHMRLPAVQDVDPCCACTLVSTTGHSTSFVASLQIPSAEEEQDHWVRRDIQPPPCLLCCVCRATVRRAAGANKGRRGVLVISHHRIVALLHLWTRSEIQE